jgi:hypothetical protein
MAPHKTVTINGRAYDAITGLPIEPISVIAPNKTPMKKKPAPAPLAKPQPKTSRGVATSETVHSNLQRSQTLLRRATKKPEVPNKPITRRATPGRHMDIAKSAGVARFAKHPAVEAPVAKPDKPARVHPVTQRTLTRTAPKKAAPTPAKPVTAKEVKDERIAKALAAPKAKVKKQPKFAIKHLRRIIIIGSIVLVVAIALFAAWRLVPNISVSIAAAQAGIEARYPEFTPDGYSLSQPVSFSDGEVDLKFTSNSNENYYTISQARSSWDSSAVLDNVVTPAAGANYVTTKERGLTIYTWDTNAAWVNGGILYQINSKAPLSGDQIRRIATSL